jgi:glycosyltransferase involved in cell wall biosynthesis
MGNTNTLYKNYYSSKSNQQIIYNQSTQIRIIKFLDILSQNGYDYSLINTPYYTIEKIKDEINSSDIIFFNRIQGSILTYIDLKFLFSFYYSKKNNKKIIFDIDDAIHLTFPILTEMISKLSDIVIVGSHYLYEYYKKYNNNVILVPSSVDINVIKPINSNKNKEFVIGWHGSAITHINNIKLLKPIIMKLNKRYDFTLSIIGTTSDLRLQKRISNFFPSIKINFGPTYWVPYDEIPYILSTFDVGVYPLKPTIWNMAKCSMKLLEYMAMELPTCSSKIGENIHILQNGIDGFLCGNEDEWINFLSLLIENEKIRNEIGLMARKKIMNKYDISKNASLLLKILGNNNECH